MRSLLVVAAALTGCVTPRSMTIGQMAAPVGRGATEVSVFGGVMYGNQSDPPTKVATVDSTVDSQVQHRVLGAPLAEANIQHGFDEHFALNIHASSAGVEPGLKWTVNTSRFAHVALLPSIGVGYASYANSTFNSGNDGVQTEVAPGSTTAFTFLAGLKILVSHRSGFFAGVGYDFLFNRSVSSVDRGTGASGDASRTTTQTLAHQASASVGFDIALGMVHIRPEVALAIYPGIAKYFTVHAPPSADTQDGGGGGFGWAIFPGFSIAVQSPRRELTDDEKEEERAKVRKHRKSDGDSDDDDDDEVKEQDPAPRQSKPKKSRDDDDDDRPRKRSGDDDDDLRNDRR